LRHWSSPVTPKFQSVKYIAFQILQDIIHLLPQYIEKRRKFMINPDPPKDEVIYIDLQGRPHDTPQECIEANLGVEEAGGGQYQAGGNCGQDPSNIPDNKG